VQELLEELVRVLELERVLLVELVLLGEQVRDLVQEELRGQLVRLVLVQGLLEEIQEQLPKDWQT
jgi:hypothetical protein